jgi:hypothetical protein
MIILYSGKKEYGYRRQKLPMDFGVWPETAIRLSPPQTFLYDFRKPRWLLWLEGPSSDESRRAAAALRFPTAMLTN